MFFFILLASSLSGQITRNACTDVLPVRIVILGSSTASGAGASHPDSAWVNRYRNELKKINPDIEVINLAVGGYTTYRLMPDNFATPMNRPPIDSAKNITQALSLNPDAIIINLPSNDRQWPMNEQLSNFDSLYNHSWNNGVPLYVCTTQPIAGNWAAYQSAVKDSILQKFGSNAIDFFTPLADSAGNIIPSYAADAVHLNDSGHGILFQQAWNKDLLIDIIPGKSGVDVMGVDLFIQGQACAGQTQYSVSFANIGDANSSQVSIKIVKDGVDSLIAMVPFNVTSCSKPTVWFGDSLTPGTHRFDVTILEPTDTNASNNSFTVYETFYERAESGIPSKQYFCAGDTVYMPTAPVFGDTLYWNNTANKNITPSPFPITADTAFFVNAATGPFTYQRNLQAASTHNISFNGNMFNLIADSALTLNEINFVGASTGTLYPAIEWISGSYRGRENQPQLWSRLAADTVVVSQINDSITLPVSLTFSPGDTIGFYVHFLASGQRLRYQGSTQPITYGSSALQFASGSGISYNYGTIYDNRSIAASFAYSYGFDRDGQCAESPHYVQYLLDSLKFDWPTDTVLNYSGSLLQVDPAYNNVEWTHLDSGVVLSTLSMLWVDSTTSLNDFNLGIRLLSPLGCYYADTVRVQMENDLSVANLESSIKLYPNPSAGIIRLAGLTEPHAFRLIDFQGRTSRTGVLLSSDAELDLSELPSGVYVLKLTTANSEQHFRVLLTD